jgi:hypothetical protein
MISNQYVFAEGPGAGRQPWPRAAGAAPLSFFVARGFRVWIALVTSLLVALAVGLVNTAIERLCDHVAPGTTRTSRSTCAQAGLEPFPPIAESARAISPRRVQVLWPI